MNLNKRGKNNKIPLLYFLNKRQDTNHHMQYAKQNN